MAWSYSASLPRWMARIILATTLLTAVMLGSSIRVAAQSPTTTADPAQVKAHVKEILSQPEFKPEAEDSFMAKIGRDFHERWDRAARWVNARWNAFRKWLEHLWPSGGGGAGMAVTSVISKSFAVLFILFGGWLIAWLLRTLWLNRRQTQAKARTAYDEAEADDGLALEPNVWMQQAEGYAGSDDYRRAFRAVFVAILLLLDEGGLIEFDRSRTNGDYLRLLRRKNVRELYDILDPLVIEFDRRWYGRAETGLEDYKRIQQTFERVRGLMSDAPPVGAAVPATGKA